MQKPAGSFHQALVRSVGKLVLGVGVVSLAGTAWLALSHTREAAQRDLAQALERSVERLRLLIEATEMTAVSVERMARNADFAGEAAAPLRAALELSLSAFEQRPELSFLGVALARHGEYGNLQRTADGSILLWLHPGKRPFDVLTRNFLLTERGFAPNATQPSSGYDARERPFYQTAVAGPEAGIWMPSYQWLLHNEEGTPPWGLSYVKPLHDHQGQLIGALDVDFDLPALNRFLLYLAGEYGVQLRLVEHGETPRLIGGPGVGARPLAVPPALAAALQRHEGAAVQKISSAEEDHWIASSTMQLRGGQRWTMVASRPAPLIEGPLRTQLYQMTAMALAMALGLMLVAGRMARRIGRPLAELELSVERAGDSGSAQALVLAASSGQYRETRCLGEALLRLASALRLREAQLAAQTGELLLERDYGNAVLNSLPGVFYHCDENGRLQRWNRNLEHVTGMGAQALMGMKLTCLMPADERQRAAGKIAEVLERGMAHFEASYELPNGKRVPCLFTGVRFVHEGVRGFVGLGSDISQRKRAERRLRHLATHDALTDLPNRYLLQERLQQLIEQAKESGRTVAVLLLDLDRFKLVNDAYGHPFGDEVIKAISARLMAALPPGHTVARHGGDEFMVLLDDLDDARQAQRIAETLIACTRAPLALQGREIHMSVSIGVSSFPQDGGDPHTLIRNADQAMYRAKHGGRNTFAHFEAGMNERMQERVRLEAMLRLAPQAGQLRLVYQPQVSLRSGEIIGCEALVRWHHPELGIVPPGKFIPVAEESGLIMPISDWVLRTACTQAKAWSDAGLPHIPVAVNISAAQLLQQDLSAWALGMLEETGLAPQLLELELTESMLAQDVDRMIDTFDQLKAAGVRLSIDDFGTGYSNLSHLKNLRVDTLKIDQSFVQNMLERADDETIVRAVIALAHNLRLKVIAEGVETEEQCRILRAHQCDEIQGYHFSRPVSAQEFEAMVRQGRRLQVAGTA